MEKRVAVMGIIVEDPDSVERLNALLHEFGEYIIGRMGIPYRARSINIVSIAIDAPQNVISALSGKIGNLPGISVKTAYSNVTDHE
ncbi:MAG: iron-only hydrogenase system regulator [Ruminococcaceae bacterium]|nr:iron-only hydrogenase system regulator [Oscillospiraceae bacterium]MBQ4047078.1 iron-only hydrogenase system regulator [Clostridia bacterium]